MGRTPTRWREDRLGLRLAWNFPEQPSRGHKKEALVTEGIVTMISLMFWVCLQGASCQEVTLTFSGDGDGGPVTAQMCLLRGQIEMARWIADHPGYRIGADPVRGTAYRCGNAQMAKNAN
jgi:hypothetical protein